MQKSAMILSVGFLIAILTGIVGYTALTSPKDGQSVTLPANGFTEHGQYYDIVVDYATSTPLVATAGPAKDAAARSMMYGFIRDTVGEFKRNGNFSNLSKKDIEMMGYADGRRQTLQVGYQEASAPRTVSYIYTIYLDTLGAHGNTYFHTFTFDKKTGAPLKLGDLFTPNASYLQTLSTLARARLPRAMGEYAVLRDIEQGTTPEEANFENFYLENGDFVLLFPPYQVAAYAAGPQIVKIPRTELAAILREEYR